MAQLPSATRMTNDVSIRRIIMLGSTRYKECNLSGSFTGWRGFSLGHALALWSPVVVVWLLRLRLFRTLRPVAEGRSRLVQTLAARLGSVGRGSRSVGWDSWFTYFLYSRNGGDPPPALTRSFQDGFQTSGFPVIRPERNSYSVNAWRFSANRDSLHLVQVTRSYFCPLLTADGKLDCAPK
jgi:hypothetical protein